MLKPIFDTLYSIALPTVAILSGGILTGFVLSRFSDRWLDIVQSVLIGVSSALLVWSVLMLLGLYLQ